MRHVSVSLLVLALVAMPARGLAAQPRAATDGTELASAQSGLDGSLVHLEGEVVSEMLAGGEGHVWINILSGGTAIGVWTPIELTGDLEVFGGWAHTGDIVAVEGVFSEGCDVHGGDMDVHASAITLLERGARREHPVAYWKLGVGMAGAFFALVTARRVRRLREGDDG